MKIAMVAPPWLPIPPMGYGGIENVLAALVPALIEEGVDVELFTVGETTLKATKNHWLYEKGQYDYIHAPMYDTLPIPMAHLLFALNTVQAAGDFDIIHAHNGFVDFLASSFMDTTLLPPIIHTMHGPPFTTPDRLALNLPDSTPMWEQLGKTADRRVHVVGISHALIRNAPAALRPALMQPVHNGLNPADFPFVTKKKDHFITLARSHPDKGQGIAARLCQQLGVPLRLAGVVCDMSTPEEVIAEVKNPQTHYRRLADFRYFSEEIFPYLDDQIIYVGDISGTCKLDLLSQAKALLFPIQWDEPFGMAPVEALACGTPVVAMARGALPEIIEHGVNGFLANTEAEFKHYMRHVGDIDPAACRASVEKNFSARHMAQEYIKRYKQLLKPRRLSVAARSARSSKPLMIP